MNCINSGTLNAMPISVYIQVHGSMGLWEIIALAEDDKRLQITELSMN